MCEESTHLVREGLWSQETLEAFFLHSASMGKKGTAWLRILTLLILLLCVSLGIYIPMWYTNVHAPHAFPTVLSCLHSWKHANSSAFGKGGRTHSLRGDQHCDIQCIVWRDQFLKGGLRDGILLC